MPVFNYISNLIDDPDPVIITPFGGYANDTMIHAQGRVLEDEGIEHSEEDSAIKNIWHSFKRFESDEKGNATVKVSWGDQERTLVSDAEGYVYLDEEHLQHFTHEETLWIPITYRLMDGERAVFETTSMVMKPSPKAEYGIISDLDDTVIETGVASTFKWRLLVNALTKHSHNRLPLEGAQEFYKMLFKGKSGYADNPFFYLSNSPWNIHDYLTAFLKKFEFPDGVIMLRDIGITFRKRKSFMEGNKFRKIKHILETYPKIPFILIGDAGEIDADIYLKIASLFPEQVLAIYIRAVDKASKIKRIEKLIEAHTDISVMIVRSKEDAISHARANGFIE